MPQRNSDAEKIAFSEHELKAIIQIIKPPFTMDSKQTSFKQQPPIPLTYKCIH